MNATEEIIVTVYVRLPEEGSPTILGVPAASLGGDLYRLLPEEGYDPEETMWEFPPNSIVRCETALHNPQGYEPKVILRAVEQIG